MIAGFLRRLVLLTILGVAPGLICPPVTSAAAGAEYTKKTSKKKAKKKAKRSTKRARKGEKRAQRKRVRRGRKAQRRVNEKRRPSRRREVEDRKRRAKARRAKARQAHPRAAPRRPGPRRTPKQRRAQRREAERRNSARPQLTARNIRRWQNKGISDRRIVAYVRKRGGYPMTQRNLALLKKHGVSWDLRRKLARLDRERAERQHALRPIDVSGELDPNDIDFDSVPPPEGMDMEFADLHRQEAELRAQRRRDERASSRARRTKRRRRAERQRRTVIAPAKR